MKIIFFRLLFLCSIFLTSCKKSENPTVAPVTSVPPGMVLVQGGTFQMGSTEGYGEETPLHPVTVSSFFLDAKEVTVAEYRAYCAATGTSMPSPPSQGWLDDNPIGGMSWNTATAYAAWAGKRLATEAEWEYAARGGVLTHGYAYSGSNTIGDVAWHESNSENRTHAVGTKAPNELGLYDMTGNVWEWCSDWFAAEYYAVSPSADPPGPASGNYRILRGGAVINNANLCRVAYRGRMFPNGLSWNMVNSPFLGFRCAKDL